jgi:trimethylamine--corrinoid protein Co-methyltransferase
MARPTLQVLDPDELRSIRDGSLRILAETGVEVPHPGVLGRLADAGARIDTRRGIARMDEAMVTAAVEAAGKRYVLRGRDPGVLARYGFGDTNLMSSPGQFGWFDTDGDRRPPCLADARAAIRLGDRLSEVAVVGAMAVPSDVPPAVRDVVLTAELVRGTTKPTRCWPISKQSTRYVLEIYRAIAGGSTALRDRPMVETFLEPISPLRFPTVGLDVMLEYLEAGQPVSIGPMAMVAGTGPGTLAGTLVQEHAEILAGIVMVQTIAPGTPIMYGGIPHVMDPRTSICSFGSPEQGLLAVAMAQVARSYGFPVYVNVNLTDAKVLDAQAGMEKMSSFVVAMLAGVDQVGHGGIVGTDHGGSLAWLVVDDEAARFARRIGRGVRVDDETLALDVIAAVGPGGDYLAEEHTVRHFREELLLPSPVWTRQTYEGWRTRGATSMGDRAAERAAALLAGPGPEPLDDDIERELDRIVAAATRELTS